jgi:PAS domain S-box-containing protein
VCPEFIYHFVGRDAPNLSVEDLVYLSGYPVVIAGIGLYIVSRRKGSLARCAMDAALISIPVAMILWEFVVAGHVASANLSTGDPLALSFPILDLIMLGAAFALLINRRPAPDTRLLGLAISLLLFADVAFSTDLLSGTYRAGVWYDGVWLAAYVVWAAAALHPTATREVGAVRRGQAEDPNSALALIAVAGLIAAYSFDFFRGDEVAVGSIIVGGGITMLLAIGRMWMELRSSRLSERALRDSEDLLRHAFDEGPSGMALGTLDGKFIKVNDAFATMLGYDADELEGVATASITHPDDRQLTVDRFALMAVGELEEFHEEKRYIHRDGHEVWVQVNLGLSRGADQNPRMVVRHTLDMSRSRELETQLRQAEKMEAVGHLAGGIAHDFNNLLSVVLNYSEFIAGDLGPTHPSFGDLQQVKAAGARGAALTRQLLMFSRRDIARTEVIAVNHALEELEPLLKQFIPENIEFEIECDPDVPDVAMDPGHLDQILMNLTVNAKDAMPTGGELKISTRAVSLPDGSKELGLVSGGFARISVSDTGGGIPDDVREHIFEPFFTTKERDEGTGLGLATVYAIVTQLGGAIDIETRSGVGTKIHIYLPASRAASIDDSNDHEHVVNSLDVPVLAVLVVEDEPSVRSLTTRILLAAGHTVVEASDGAEALQALSEESFDLLVSDIIMPGMSGSELRRKVDLPAVLMSGYPEDVIQAQGGLPPETELIMKPFTSAQLLGAIGNLMSRPSPARGESKGRAVTGN